MNKAWRVKKLKKIMIENNINNLNREENPKENFRNLLCEEDFAKLEKLHDDTKEAVDWETLASSWVCKINFDGKLEWVIWPSDLNLVNCSKLTSLEPIKEIKGSLFIAECDNLVNLDSLQIIWKILQIYNCNKLTKLDSIENIWKNLNIYNCSKLESLGSKNIWETLLIYACDNLVSLWDKVKILLSLDLKNASYPLQIEAFFRDKKEPGFIWKELFINSNFKKLLEGSYTIWELDFKEFFKIYWKHIWEIEDEEWKEQAKSILVYFYKEKLKETNEKIESLVKELEIKKEEVQRLHDEFVEFKTKIENFWIKLEELEN